MYNKNPGLPVISFNIDNLDNDSLGLILRKKYGIITRTGLLCAPLIHERMNSEDGCVRISLSYLNTEDECQYVASSLAEVARSCRY